MNTGCILSTYPLPKREGRAANVSSQNWGTEPGWPYLEDSPLHPGHCEVSMNFWSYWQKPFPKSSSPFNPRRWQVNPSYSQLPEQRGTKLVGHAPSWPDSLWLPTNQPATAYLHPKLMQALFPARNREAVSFWEKSKGNMSLLALKKDLARVPRGYLSCFLLPRKLEWSSQSIPSIHCTPRKRPPASWARDTASTASTSSKAGWLQKLWLLRSYGRSGKRWQQQGTSIVGLLLEITKSRDSVNRSSTLIRLYQRMSATKNATRMTQRKKKHIQAIEYEYIKWTRAQCWLSQLDCAESQENIPHFPLLQVKSEFGLLFRSPQNLQKLSMTLCLN